MEVLYVHSEQFHNFNAAKEVLPLVVKLFNPTSILDVGCGTGTWLKIAKDIGINDIKGIDGGYVDKSSLKISPEEFIEKDLRLSFDLGRKFDLGFCLEVAEHLPSSSASLLVDSLCRHSDTIIFSAAIPNQGGQNHINEQWPSYWIDLFAGQGFSAYDILRPVFWDNEKVEFWYKQNMIVFSRKKIMIPPSQIDYPAVNAYVHPELFESLVVRIKMLEERIENRRNKPGVKESLNLFLKSIKRKLFS